MEIDWEGIAKRLDEELVDRRISSDQLADMANVNRKTVLSLRKGNTVRLHSLSQIEKALGIDLREGSASGNGHNGHAGIAPEEFGGYSLSAYAGYVGCYYMFRCSYDHPDRIICAQFEITVDMERSCLVFCERQLNMGQGGKVYAPIFTGPVLIPAGISVIQFISGAGPVLKRVIETTTLRGTEKGFFKGVLVGINEITDIGFYPAATPVYIEQAEFHPECDDPRVGSFDVASLWHQEARELLQSAASTFISRGK